MTETKNIGSTICKYRKQAGMTQESFASKLGLTPQAVSKWETGSGYPDVALLPTIADVLGVSIDCLFGNDSKEFVFPTEFKGLGCVYAGDERAFYSDKKVSVIDKAEGVITFLDGSTVNIFDGVVFNRGEGEIRVCESLIFKRRLNSNVKTTLKRELAFFDTLNVSVTGSVAVYIEPAKNGKGQVVAEGTGMFISSLDIKSEGSTAYIKARRQEEQGGNQDNKLYIYTPFDKGKALCLETSGCARTEIDVFFENIETTSSGASTVKGCSCNVLSFSSDGSGELNMGTVNVSTLAKVNGSGTLKINEANDVVVAISGSGECTISNLKSSLKANVHGATTLSATGDAKRIELNVNGAGDFDGERLTVDTAIIDVSGAADVCIGRIKDYSKERLGENSTLRVIKRG